MAFINVIVNAGVAMWLIKIGQTEIGCVALAAAYAWGIAYYMKKKEG